MAKIQARLICNQYGSRIDFTYIVLYKSKLHRGLLLFALIFSLIYAHYFNNGKPACMIYYRSGKGFLATFLARFRSWVTDATSIVSWNLAPHVHESALVPHSAKVGVSAPRHTCQYCLL